jgi:hypothetical protein
MELANQGLADGALLAAIVTTVINLKIVFN